MKTKKQFELARMQARRKGIQLKRLAKERSVKAKLLAPALRPAQVEAGKRTQEMLRVRHEEQSRVTEAFIRKRWRTLHGDLK